jgi:dTDP-4-dehydrorhamnose reductase
VRPDYTFGNPAVKGGNIEADTRFSSIVENAVSCEPIEVIKNDRTQFIDASDLAKIYLSILGSEINGKTYFGLGNRFITWEEIAVETMKLTDSKSELIVKDLGWPADPALFDVTAIRRDFNLSFNSWEKIVEHLNYMITR